MRRAPIYAALVFACATYLASKNWNSVFFVPMPGYFAKQPNFGCPEPMTIFTYDVPAWNTSKPNRMIALSQEEFACRIKSDAQGVYEWFAGISPLADQDIDLKRISRQIWPLRVGTEFATDNNNQRPGWDKVRLSVETYGLAKVPAGLFWAYKIRRVYINKGQILFTTTLWWSPTLRWTIRQWPERPGEAAQVGGLNWNLVTFETP